MYLPKHFEEQSTEALHALMTEHPLGTFIAQAEDKLLVNHVPFLLDAGRGQYGTLVAHVARANPVWKALANRAESIVVFQGPQAYVSPSWYPSKKESGKAVPTWNYAVVHAHGVPNAIEDKKWLLEHVGTASERYEAAQERPWRLTDAPSEYIEAMLGAIVGIEIPISKLVGKFKVSQNRPKEDKIGVVTALQYGGSEYEEAMANFISRRIGGE